MNTGCLYSRRASTILAPNLRISLAMSRVPPEKPRQLAKIISGRFSPRLKSAIACAVLNAESGNHTWPACCSTVSRESGLAGSAGRMRSERRVSTAMTPIGMPPRRARPTTTDLPHPARYSLKVPLSKKPDCHLSPSITPASMCRGSYGALVGTKSMSREMESVTGRIGGAEDASFGTNDSQSSMALTPSWSLGTCWCETPFGIITCGPPSWSWEVYTSFPRSLLSAEYPVRMSGPSTIWIVRCPRRTRYAPMPTDRPVTKERVKVSSYAREVSPAIRPEPRRFSTPMP
mmetsp:Transcript_40106/g.95123  ORF Transcript_40106/g.95123 Transcript_40106/m.95123 type:complete len:289 (+) Transcript_40106:818-1684(+)